MSLLTLDFETTTKNNGHPFTPGNFAVSCAAKRNEEESNFYYYTDPDFVTNIRRDVSGASELVIFAGKFELHWLRNLGIKVPKGCRIFDPQIAEYVITGQQAVMSSLESLLEEYALPLKLDEVKRYWEAGIDTPDINYNVVKEYNIDDVEKEYAVRLIQLKQLSAKQLKLVYKMGEDTRALADAEYNGIKYDRKLADTRLAEYMERVKSIESDLNQYLPDGIPDYDGGFNWDSGDQLSAFLYGGTITYDYPVSSNAIYQTGPKQGETYTRNKWYKSPVVFKPIFKTLPDSEIEKTKDRPKEATHLYQTDDPTLKRLICRSKSQKDIIKYLQDRAKFIKVAEMIEGLNKRCEKYEWGDYIHGRFNQTVAATGRLSSSDPNMQNAPEEIDELFVSRYV